MDLNTLKFVRAILNSNYNIDKKNNFLIKYRNFIEEISSKSYERIKDMSFINVDIPKQNVEDSKKMALEFLSKYFSEYVFKCEQILYNDKMKFGPHRSRISNDGSTIYIHQTNSILDLYYIIHEFMHYVNFVKANSNHSRNILAETISIMSEFLVSDYLLKNGYTKGDVSLAFSQRLYLIQKDIKEFIKENSIVNKILNNQDNEEVMNFLRSGSFYDDFVEEIQGRYSDPLQEKLSYIAGMYISLYFYFENADLASVIKKLNQESVKNVDVETLLGYCGMDIPISKNVDKMVTAFNNFYDDSYSLIKEKSLKTGR